MESGGGIHRLDQLFPEEIKERDLPPCDLEHLEEILMVLKTSHPGVRPKVLRDLANEDGAYIVKLLNVFDLSELGDDRVALHKLFDIFYAIVELCDRRLIEILLSDTNFLSVVGVFGYNPSLIREMDFRSDLEGEGGFNEVVPITDRSVVDRVHMNFRIQVIKDNVLARSLPDCSVLMLEQIVNENNYHILSYISDTEEYWQAIKELIRGKEKRLDGLGLLKAIIQLVRVTKPLDKLMQPRRDPFGAPPVFGALLGNLFGDGEIFEAFGNVLGPADSKPKEIALAVDILSILVFYQGPDRLRSYLASEGKCIAAPKSQKDRISWTPGSSLFTALLVVFERNEATRVQMFTLLREIFRVPLGQDDKFLSVLYPNYIHWMLQPLKCAFVEDEPVLFDLQDSIMELLTFCTESHGYRVKYLFGRQPIASYAERMLRSKKKLFVIHAVKFIRSCAARAEAFFSRFLIQNDLFTPIFANLEIGKKNSDAVSSAILELLAFIEKTNLTSLIEHIHTKFYETYKAECPLVFEAIHSRYTSSFGSDDVAMDPTESEKVHFVQQTGIDEEEELYWEKDTDTPESFTPILDKNGVSEEEITCRNRSRSVKLVDYEDDDEPTASLKEGDVVEEHSTPIPIDDGRPGEKDKAADEELKLPVREKKEEEIDTQSFLGGSALLAQKKAQKKVGKKVRSPPYKNMFQTISWKLSSPSSGDTSSNTLSKMADENEGESGGAKRNSNSVSVVSGHEGDDSGDAGSRDASVRDSTEETVLITTKRKLAIGETKESESLLKKAKTGTPISSS